MLSQKRITARLLTGTVKTTVPSNGPLVAQTPFLPIQGLPGVGIPGRDGTAAGAFTHTQTVASATWTINHNLGFEADVTCTDNGGNVIFGQVLHTSTNTAIVYWNTPQAGKARLE